MITSALSCILFSAFLLQQDLNEAIRLYRTGRYRESATLLSRMAAGQDANADLYLWLGKASFRMREWDEAAKALEKAVQLQPANGTAHLWLGRAYGEKASKASVFSAFGLARKVAHEFEEAVRLAPDNMDARFDLLQYYLQAPGVVGGGKDKAEAEARAVAERNPQLGYTARAAIYEHDKRWDEARAELARATSEFPAQAVAFEDFAEYLLRRGDFAAAQANAVKALQLDKNRKSAELVLAAAQVELRRDVEAAESELGKLSAGPLMDDDPAFRDVYFWLGKAYLIQGRRDDARQALQTALLFDPDYAPAKSTLAGIP